MILRALRAKHGDSILLLGEGVKVLVDGGPSGVYNQTLRGELRSLDSDGEDEPRIDLLIVSHIDADHIDGVLDLTDELLEARDEERDPLIKLAGAWHNSFADVIAQDGPDTSGKVKATAANVAGAFDELLGLGAGGAHSTTVLASVGQGRQLRLDLKALNIEQNKGFTDRVVLQGTANRSWERGNLKLDVLGPTQAELDDLREEWKKQLAKILAEEGPAAVAAAGGLDKSVSNLASIVVIAESDGKRALLTGDARGDMIIDWLEATGGFEPDGTTHFDIVKLPHHGSDRNVDREFFRRVTADEYVVCGNGGHGNPEPAMFEMLFEERPDLNYRIHMTYGPDELKEHSSFIKADNGPKLDAVLAKPGRMETLQFPAADATHIDIEF